MQSPRRISVVGATGSGKTVLATEIAKLLDLPYCGLDQLRMQVAEFGPPGESFESRVADLALGDEWIIDGHYREVRDLIWRRAEVVVWLNYPLPVVALRLMKRFRRKRREGANRVDEAFLATRRPAGGASWKKRLSRVVKTLRERGMYGRLLRSNYPKVRIVELRSIKATQRWLRDL